MKAKDFWAAKVRMALHDPPHKPFVLKPFTGGHGAHARSLMERVLGEGVRPWYVRRADWAASGADRPVLDHPRGRGIGRLTCDFARSPLVVHALMGDAALAVPVPAGADTKPHELAKRQVVAVLSALDEEADRLDERGGEIEADEATLQGAFWWMWRAWRDNLSLGSRGRSSHPLWDLLPADSRCPDHPIWEHLRVASALAFLGVRDDARHPWLLSMSVAPVQAFIGESRTSRDLWMSSFLISELAFAAITPFIERYGPDCILYPDLRGNARMDVWMRRHRRDALPDSVTDPCTQAALIPDSFVVLVPQGSEEDTSGDSHLRHLQTMAGESQATMKHRWRALCGLVERWMNEKTRRQSESPGKSPWKSLWDEQIGQGPQLSWTAVKWDRPLDLKEKVEDAASLQRRESLPAQESHPRSEQVDRDQKKIERRRARLAPWLPVKVAAHYESAREVFAAVNLVYLQNERGFDYPIAHHALRMRHRLRAGTGRWSGGSEFGEKCTMCGKRQALSDQPAQPSGTPVRLDDAREAARTFWARGDLDPDERGAERLCAICAVKRFLVVASSNAGDEAADGLGPVLFGDGWEKEKGEGDKLRVPFPSTAAVALQDYLAWAVESTKGRDLLEALRAARLPRTSFPRTLVRLALALRSGGRAPGKLLEYDAQYAMPHTLDAEIARLETAKHRIAGKLQAYKRIRAAAGRLHDGYCKDHDAPPDTRVAVMALDADRLGRLLLGDPERIGATWRDVLHPEIVTRIEEAQQDTSSNLQWAIEAGWPRLLGQPRHMGPSLHAFITRALAVFANTIVPWVVECEYRGRLIYAGGDDVLALAPAEDALRMAARLQQLFSAPWVVDTRPDEEPWSWRRQRWTASASGDAEALRRAAQARFVIPMKALGATSIVWPIQWAEPHCDPGAARSWSDTDGAATPRAVAADRSEGRVYAMLGRHQSLSAGLAYAHYKTDLRLLVGHARYLLDEVAKRKSGRCAVAVGHFSRNGEKTEFAMQWSPNGGPPVAQRQLLEVIEGFRHRTLPGRLPYKLRDLTDLALAEGPQTGSGSRAAHGTGPSEPFLRGLLSTALDSDVARDLRDTVIELWTQGFRLHGASGHVSVEPAPERAVDGLLFCRALARPGEDR